MALAECPSDRLRSLLAPLLTPAFVGEHGREQRIYPAVRLLAALDECGGQESGDGARDGLEDLAQVRKKWVSRRGRVGGCAVLVWGLRRGKPDGNEDEGRRRGYRQPVRQRLGSLELRQRGNRICGRLVDTAGFPSPVNCVHSLGG